MSNGENKNLDWMFGAGGIESFGAPRANPAAKAESPEKPSPAPEKKTPRPVSDEFEIPEEFAEDFAEGAAQELETPSSKEPSSKEPSSKEPSSKIQAEADDQEQTPHPLQLEQTEVFQPDELEQLARLEAELDQSPATKPKPSHGPGLGLLSSPPLPPPVPLPPVLPKLPGLDANMGLDAPLEADLPPIGFQDELSYRRHQTEADSPSTADAQPEAQDQGGELLDLGLIPPPLKTSPAAEFPKDPVSDEEDDVGYEDMPTDALAGEATGSDEAISNDSAELELSERVARVLNSAAPDDYDEPALEEVPPAEAASLLANRRARKAQEARDEKSESSEALSVAEATAMFDKKKIAAKVTESSEEIPAHELAEMISERQLQEPPSTEHPRPKLLESSEELSAEEAAALINARPPSEKTSKIKPDIDSNSKSVRQVLETRSEATTLRGLAKRGVKNVRIMDMATIQDIITEAVENCLSRYQTSMSQEEREQLENEAKKEFFELLAKHKKLEQEKTQAEETRDLLQKQVNVLNSELDKQQRALAEENKRHKNANEANFSETSFEKMAEHIRSLFKDLVDDERRQALAEFGESALPGMDALEDKLGEVLSGLISSERERTLEESQAAHKQRVQILEARIAKLNSALTNTEDALRKVAAMKEIDHGVASIYDAVQGLALDDGDYERKSELLKIVFLENLQLQGKDITEEDKDVVDIEEPERVDAEPNFDMLDGFAAPLDVESLTSESAF